MSNYQIRRADTVFTADKQRLGEANMIYLHPNHDKRYDTGRILFVVDSHHGRDFYIPIKYIDYQNSDTGEIFIRQAADELEAAGLTDRPAFVANNEAVKQPLAQEPSLVSAEEVPEP